MPKRYLLGIDADGHHGCGNEYTIITEYKSRLKHLILAEQMMKGRIPIVEIYVFDCYTPEMQEMSPHDLTAHIKKFGRRLI